MAGRRSFLLYISLLVFVSFLSSCAGTIVNMREVPPDKVVTAPESGKALVVFMRPSGFGFAISSSVFEVKGDTLSLVGIIAAKAKVAYQVEPGNHLFMVVSEAADFMSADLQANKTYYVRVIPRPGVWKARFSLSPVHSDALSSSTFAEWLADCKWVEKSPESDAWANSNMPDIKKKQAKYYPEWKSKYGSGGPGLAPGDGK